MEGKEKDAYGILRESLQIDPLKLDRALIEHSSLFYQVGRWCATAQSRADAARDDRQRLDAELKLEKRRQATARKGKGEEKEERVTDSQILAAVEADPRRVAAEDVMRVRQKDLSLWLALKEAFSQRSFMLRSLVQLYVSEYFAVAGADSSSKTHRRHATDRVKEQAATGYRELATTLVGQGGED